MARTGRVGFRTWAGCLAALALVLACWPRRARADPRDELLAGRFWFGMGVEAADGRLLLRTAQRQARPDPRESFVAGLRLSAEYQVHQRVSVELALHGQHHLVVDTPMLELAAASRYSVRLGPRSVLYLRPTGTIALASFRMPQAGFGFGFSVGYRRVQSRSMARFVELTYRMRVFPDSNARYAETTFPEYGYHPEDVATLFASFLGVVGGVGFGPFPSR